MARILAVVAHPDDEVLGIGGTLLRHVAEGDEVRVHIACCGYGLRERASRVADAYAVAAEMGTDLSLGDDPQLGRGPMDFDELVARTKPDIVYTHHADLNSDHRLVLEAVKVATRPFASQVRALRCFETPSSTEWGEPFRPNHFVSIDLAAKTALLAHYASELRPAPHPRSAAVLGAHALLWGSHVGMTAAEPLHTLWERR
jgi:N-acetylglucosamine malate deacetylase 1